ncbi:MAG: DNA cytosine methyltransferase [Gemmatimonadota bacterium]
MKAVSLFSGAGGLDLGFRQAGFDLVWAVDSYADAVESYRKNISDHIVLADLAGVEASSVPHGDVIIGGFPCQGFSVANITRSSEDGRNKLYLEFVRILRNIRPQFFLAENVKGILSLADGVVFQEILADFAKVGYTVAYSLLNAADYGVPQSRQRVFLLGAREDVACDLSAFPPVRTHADSSEAAALGLSPWIGVGDALADVPEPDAEHDLPNHDGYSRYKLRFNGYLGHRRINPAMPSPTLTARGDDRGGVVVLHHPDNHRRISPREAARIQGFPDWFAFAGTRTSAYRQIANAVPPPLARAVAASILDCASGSSESAIAHGSRLEAEHPIQPSLL